MYGLRGSAAAAVFTDHLFHVAHIGGGEFVELSTFDVTYVVSSVAAIVGEHIGAHALRGDILDPIVEPRTYGRCCARAV